MFTTTLSPQTMRQAALWCAFVSCAAGLVYKSSLPTAITILERGSLSPVIHARLQEQISPSLVATLPTLRLLSHIQEYAPTAESLTIRYDRHHHATVTITHTPAVARINGTHLVTKRGKLVLSTLYPRTVTDHLPTLSLSPGTLERQPYERIAHFIATLPAEITEEYALYWHDKTHIDLIPHTSPHGTITVWSETIWSENLLHALRRIEKLLNERRPVRKGAPAQMQWRVDARIPHYCIVSPTTKGEA